MKTLFTTTMLLIWLYPNIVIAQESTTDTSNQKIVNLKEVVFSVNKTEEPVKTVAQQVLVLDAAAIENKQAQTTADLISNEGGVFIQKSQAGGGSVSLRGFEANRTLLVIDGVRMNNLIYRAGHLQNIVTTDNNVFDRIEILFGPSSTVYGSDALGGVIHMYTKKPMLATQNEKSNIKVNFLSRYGSVNNEITNHLDFNIGNEKFASLTSFTYSNFDHLKGGENLNPFYTKSYGERPYYVDRIDGKDSLVKNSDRYLQVQSGYTQYDLLQKFLFSPNDKISHGLNIQYSNSSDVPRYDRLTDPSDEGLKYSEWYYGPQERLLAAYDLNISNVDGLFNKVHFGANYQNIEESRHTRRFNNDNLSHRIENVNVFGYNLDFQKFIRSHSIRFGIDGQFNTLKSTAENENIATGEVSGLDTRYPDGDNTMFNTALYISHTWQINDQLVLVDGLRFGYVKLHSTFVDTTFFNLPYSEVTQSNPVYSGNIGIINNVGNDWKLSALLSTGYRVPNVDDLSKVFESAPGTVIVPNQDLKPEITINGEIGITRFFNENTQWENVVYYSKLFDAIVTDKYQFNGEDSIIYDGTLSEVLANQNKDKAYIYGFSSEFRSQQTQNFVFALGMSYTYGRIKTDSIDVPLDHIPPFMAHLMLSYINKKFSSEFFVNYNGWKKLGNYKLNGEDNEQYATENGMPAWLTVNVHASYQIHKYISIQAGVDNIFDTQYRTFASGINAPGRNIFAAVRFHY